MKILEGILCKTKSIISSGLSMALHYHLLFKAQLFQLIKYILLEFALVMLGFCTLLLPSYCYKGICTAELDCLAILCSCLTRVYKNGTLKLKPTIQIFIPLTVLYVLRFSILCIIYSYLSSEIQPMTLYLLQLKYI